MFQMPMSSPMITTMFGFGCAEADAVVSAATVNSASRISSPLRVFFIACPPLIGLDQPGAGNHSALSMVCAGRSSAPAAAGQDRPRGRNSFIRRGRPILDLGPMRPALSVRRVDSRAEFSRRVPLSLRRDAEALVDPPATRRELFASAYRHLAGEPGCAIGGLEVVSLCHAADAVRPRDVG